LKIVYEDDDLIVVDKPAGILCLPSEEGVPSIAETVYNYVQQPTSQGDHNEHATTLEMDQMVVHRLGYETAGLLVLAKTIPAVRGLHTLFRMRPSQRSAPGSSSNNNSTTPLNTDSNIESVENTTTARINDSSTDDDGSALLSQHLGIVRQYEVLVVGHVANRTDGGGWINLPLMRCYEYPPYMRVSTQEQQQFLLSLDPAKVGKKLLEAPKHSLTHYEIVAYEYWQQNESLPVTRLTLTSMTGRTHQLNVHCTSPRCIIHFLCAYIVFHHSETSTHTVYNTGAAIGHPIVRDTVYGYNGTAAPMGGLSPAAIDHDLPAALAEAARDTPMCVHAKYMRFPHPITGEELEFTSQPAF
jgi:tRNA pseudouridine32 synthase / 23S rRNA pseudouridine746 synthase